MSQFNKVTYKLPDGEVTLHNYKSGDNITFSEPDESGLITISAEAGGSNYTAGDNIRITEDNVISCLLVKGTHIEINDNKIDCTLPEYKQGTHIGIENNTISCLLGEGTHIEINDNNEINCTLPEYTQGTNIGIENNTISCLLEGGTHIEINDNKINCTLPEYKPGTNIEFDTTSEPGKTIISATGGGGGIQKTVLHCTWSANAETFDKEVEGITLSENSIIMVSAEIGANKETITALNNAMISCISIENNTIVLKANNIIPLANTNFVISII